MKMIVKVVQLATLALLTLIMATSCLKTNSGAGGNNPNNSHNNEVSDKNDSVIPPNDSENENKGEKEPVDKSKTYYHAASEIMFLSEGDSDSKAASYKLLTAIDRNIISGDGYTFTGFLSENRDNEVVVGYIPEREVSVKAYEMLGQVESKSDIREVRYLVYAEGGKLAFAYEKNKYTAAQIVDNVVDLFIEKFVTKKEEICFANGVVMSGTFDLIDIQNAIDEKNNEQRWENVRNKIGDDDVYLAFRAFFEECFSDEIVELLGTYYDPATGLFYASASGKAAEGIYPIPEATSIILGYVLNTGMLNGMGVLYSLPDLARYKIIYYLKSIQASDGEFYISQMKKSNIDSNRLGRDRGACLGLFERLGAKPTYSVGSVIGDGISAEEYWASLVDSGAVTEEDKPIIYWAENRYEIARSFTESVASAVSKVIPTSSGTEPFQSHESFIKWLLAKDPYNNPYTAMSNTSSAASLISDWSAKLGGYTGDDTVVTYGAKSFDLYNGETLNEILIRWMNSYINSAGLFGKVTNSFDAEGNPVYDGFFGGWGYQNSNGFLKAIGRYNDMGIPYPEPRLAAESLLKGINSDEPMTGTILVIFNVWSSLNNLKKNITNFYFGDDRAELLSLIDDGLKRQVVVDEVTGETKSYGAIAIEKCTKKILMYKKVDGGFGHAIEYSTSTWQGGLKVAISSDNLSDVDAIACSTTYLGNAMSVLFGLNFIADVPMNTNADLLLFLDTMAKQEYVKKQDPSGNLPNN